MNYILIVEDDKAISNLLYINLKDEGYSCTCALDGLAVANYLEEHIFDLILLDVMVPHINGYELLDYIKPTGIPIIFITAMGRVDDRIKCLRSGADDYIVKPFQIGEVIARENHIKNRDTKVKLWMNAVSGKILDMDVEFLNENITISAINVDSILQRFVDHIGVIMQPVGIGEVVNSQGNYNEEYYMGKYISCYGVKYLSEKSKNSKESTNVCMRLVVARNQ